ncbi:hypothetical protein QYE76_067166 [Lolium multiflorum]|uniref:Uncharacterized protein n=1 Tax=Lolium multiflorum TaxID=4521 RepID=A0AAD8SDF9_LOLMU|nr:hypothetical protein QYE76_067166 [Lolium multiflorum]
MTEGAKRGSREEPCGPTTGGAAKAAAPPVLQGAPFASFSSRTPSSRKPKPRGILTKVTAASARRRTPERKSSPGQEPPGNSSGGEIDAIAIVIERDIISIIIIIISTIYIPSPPLHLVIAVAIREKYIQDLLARAALGDERTVDTPMELNVKLRPTDGDPLPDPTRYRHLVGSLVYLVTRPDISYPVHILSQFVSAPTTVHYSHLLRFLRYLLARSLVAFSFPVPALSSSGYSDATWEILRIVVHFLLIVFLGGSLVAWKTKKQILGSLLRHPLHFCLTVQCYLHVIRSSMR